MTIANGKHWKRSIFHSQLSMLISYSKKEEFLRVLPYFCQRLQVHIPKRHANQILK